MIQITDIDVVFESRVLESREINLHKGQITLFTGESGSGKTCLLNIVGLIDRINKYTYYSESKLITDNSKDEFIRNNISYVFQDHNMIDGKNILENFKIMYQIVGKKYNHEEVETLLKQVDLDSCLLKESPKVLSGGQRQRLALALALVKKPKLLLLDEPTAMLDEKNEQKIIGILDQIKQLGIIIVIATHKPNVFNASKIYNIRNKQLEEEIIDDAMVDTLEQKNERTKFSVLNYTLSYMKNNIFIMMLFVITITSALFMFSSNFMQVLTHYEQINQQINTSPSNEILLVSRSQQDVLLDNDFIAYSQDAKGIESNTVTMIEELQHVVNIYPYMDILPSQVLYKGQQTLGKDIELSNITYNDKTVNTQDDFSSRLNFTTVDKEVQESRLTMIDDSIDSGIYISSRLASKLGIDKLESTMITVNMPIIMGYTYQDIDVVMDSGSTEAKLYNHAVMVDTKTVYVKGVFDFESDNRNFYSVEEFADIRLTNDYVEELHEEYTNNKEIMKEYIDFINEIHYSTTTFVDEINYTMYVVRLDSPQSIQTVSGEIQSLIGDDMIALKDQASYSETQFDLVNGIAMSSLLSPVVMILVSIILIMILYTYTLYRRVKEFTILRANGIVKINNIILLDIQLICIISLFIAITILLMMSNISIHSLSIITLAMLIIVILIVLLCKIVSILFFRRINIMQELRSK